MAADVDICNLALAALGDEATVVSINPPEGSAQADHCARWYPVARDALLALPSGGWNFATRRGSTAAQAGQFGPWAQAYAWPATALRILAVLPEGGTNADACPFEVETAPDGSQVILTNEPQAVLRYTVRVEDTNQFPPLFVQALTHMLASYLAGPVLKGAEGRAEAKVQMQLALGWVGKATLADAQQRKVERRHTPAHLAARGFQA
ncbi:MAG: hypothetical protein MK041_03390 [Aquabacterium sp.]|nr:hypothetical protein [Aquabacterium sp.]